MKYFIWGLMVILFSQTFCFHSEPLWALCVLKFSLKLCCARFYGPFAILTQFCLGVELQFSIQFINKFSKNNFLKLQNVGIKQKRKERQRNTWRDGKGGERGVRDRRQANRHSESKGKGKTEVGMKEVRCERQAYRSMEGHNDLLSRTKCLPGLYSEN